MSKAQKVLTCCPTCGAALDRSGTLVDLDDNFIMHNNLATLLPPMIAELLFILNERAPAVVRRETILSRLYGAGEEPDGNILNVYVHRANTLISSLGLVIETSWGTGYALRERRAIESVA